jgi:meiotically up-regulated gene 157 (Mug157) protein
MHRSCGLSGYLHLDLSLQPRFIDRYRAIRQAIEAQGIVNNPDLGEVYVLQVDGIFSLTAS